MNILNTYSSSDGLIEDPSQLRVIEKFSTLQSKLSGSKEKTTFLQRYFKKKIKIPGIYLWGDVGRGKTFLMDIFFQSLNLNQKRRVHFHHLMSEVHTKLKEMKNIENPIDQITKSMSKNIQVLCFDEFFVEDIADAMILNKFLEGLFKYGITLVATSNSHPKDLYKNGLQRDRFLRAIKLIEENTSIINIGSGPDYRLKKINNKVEFNSIHDTETDQLLEKYFHLISPIGCKKNEAITVNGRKISSILSAETIIWFDFHAICAGNRSTADYITIAKQYQTVIISNILILDKEKENEARRFIAMIDEFYERKVKIIISTEISYKDLYQGQKLSFEYKRTQSRLTEMASEEYQKLAHIH